MTTTRVAEYSANILLCLILFGYGSIASFAHLFGAETFLPSLILRFIRLVISVYIVWFLFIKKRCWLDSWYICLSVIFFSMYIARVLVDVVITPVELIRPRYDYVKVIGSFLPAIAMSSRIRSSILKNTIEWLFTFGFIVCGVILLGLGDKLLVVNPYEINFEGLNPISIGHIGASLLLISCYIIYYRNIQSIIFRIFVWVGAIFGFLCLLYATKRGPIISFVFGVISLVAIKGTINENYKFFNVLLGFAFMTVLIYWLSSTFVSYLLSQFGSVISLRAHSAVSRLAEYRSALHQFASNPLFGDQINTNVAGGYPHNIVLEAFMATGIIGGSLIIVLIVYSLRKSFYLARSFPSVAWMVPLMVQYMIGAQFSGAIWGWPQLWSLMAMVAVTGDRVRFHFNAFSSSA